ncbi:hypothetical protein FOZ63_017888 [Perkinsus olseni]|uniref:Uncharacterized protein n=1 Tax=Perkinsus olseni TaxID=32597 RepID=A0A7J6RBM3_PEROL|nr:hypothetical protein FOZ63_017888 [Perkinsus olseni]
MPDITRACPANTSIVGRPDIPLGTGPTAITTLNQRRRLRGSLLMFCDRPSPDPSIPKTDPQADVHLGLLYDGKNLARFHIEVMLILVTITVIARGVLLEDCNRS